LLGTGVHQFGNEYVSKEKTLMESLQSLQEKILANEIEKNRILQAHSEQLMAVFQDWQKEREEFLRAERENAARLHALQADAESERSVHTRLCAERERLAASLDQKLSASQVEVELLASRLEEAKRNQAEREQTLCAVEESLRMELLRLQDANDRKDGESQALIARSSELALAVSLKLSWVSERLSAIRTQMRHDVISLAEAVHSCGAGQLKWNGDCSVSVEHKSEKLSRNEAVVELTLNDLLEPEGAEFVDTVFRGVLGRRPDPEAEKSYLRQLEAGVSKRQLILEIRCSDEGRRRGVSIGGFEDLAYMLFEPASTIEELVSYDGVAFVSCAYQTILGRMPDAKGFQSYALRLRSGVSKYEVIAELKSSEEGKRADTSCVGLVQAVRLFRMIRIPYVGRFLRAFFRSEGNTAAERRVRSLEYALSEQRAIHELELSAFRNRAKATVKQIAAAGAQVSSLAKVVGEGTFFVANVAASQSRKSVVSSTYLLQGANGEEVIGGLRQHLNRTIEAAQLQRT
jgi:hypothetical protein